jgi:hypothetical protein
MFSVKVLNTNFLDNLHILLVLEFYDFMPSGLGVIGFVSSLSVSVYFLYRSEW